MKFNCSHFAIVPLYHISSLGMFIEFFLIGVPMLETIILIGNFWDSCQPQAPRLTPGEPNFNRYLSRNVSVSFTCWVHCAIWKNCQLRSILLRTWSLIRGNSQGSYKNSGVTSGEEPACHCRRRKRCRFDPWVGKIPWRRAWQPTPVFFCRESHWQRSLVCHSP